MTIIRPKIQILNDEYKKKILDEAKNILFTQGIFMENLEAIELFNQVGINNKDQRFFIPPDIVDKALKSSPAEIKMYDREGKENSTLTGDNVHFDPGSTAISILDENSGDIRTPNSNDFIRFSKIVEQLKYIEMQSTAITYQDVPINAQDWHRLYLALLNCNKSIITGTLRKESFQTMRELLLTCRTSEKDLANKPLAIFDACATSPLQWSDLTSQSVIDAAKSMIPSEIISMPMAGETSTITLIGSITQHCAENLVGIVIAQLCKPSAPVIWGGSSAVFDMKYGNSPMGAIETMMLNIGDVEIGKFLNLPTHAYIGLSDSKVPDAQSGFESGIGAILAGLAGINVISGAGMLNFETTQSVEKLIIDNEIAGMVTRMVRGLEDYGEPFASNLLADYDEKKSFLSHRSTLKYFKKELFLPSLIINRMPLNLWKTSENKSTRKEARSMAKKMAENAPLKPLDDNLKRELDSIAEKHL